MIHLRRLDATLLVLPFLLVLILSTRFLSPNLLSDLRPRPDAIEYVVTARNLLERGRFAIIINGTELPSLYSFGFPLLIIPAYLVFGMKYGNAIYTMLGLDLLLVGLVYWLGRRLFGRWSAVVAAAIVAFSPFDAFNSREYIMSDLASSVFVVAAIIPLTYLARYSGSHRMARDLRFLALSGALLAYASWIRQVNLLYLPVFFLFLLLTYWPGRNWRRGLFRLGFSTGIFVATVTVFLSPLLVYNWVTFGGPARTGYEYWFPNPYADWRTTFSVDHAFGPDAHATRYLLALAGRPETATFGARIPLYPPFVAALAVVAVLVALLSLIRSRKSRETEPGEGGRGILEPLSLPFSFVVMAVGLIAVNYFTYSLYFWTIELRFVHLFVPLMALLASGGITVLWARSVHFLPAFNKRRVLFRFAGLALLVLLYMGSWQLVEPVQASVLWRSELFGPRSLRTPDTVWMELVSDYTEPDAVVVTESLDPRFFGAYQGLDSQRKVLELDRDWCCNKRFTIETMKDSPELGLRLISAGKSLYFIGKPSDFQALPQVANRFTLAPVASRPGWPNGPQLVLYRILLKP